MILTSTVAKKLDVYMRPEGTWISPPFGFGVLRNELRPTDDPSTRQYHFSEEEKRRHAEDPAALLQFRRNLEAEINISQYSKVIAAVVCLAERNLD